MKKKYNNTLTKEVIELTEAKTPRKEYAFHLGYSLDKINKAINKGEGSQELLKILGYRK